MRKWEFKVNNLLPTANPGFLLTLKKIIVMFWAKAIMPALLWVSLLWFLVTGTVHFPFLGTVDRKEKMSLYLGVIFLNLGMALFFTRRLW